MDKTIMSEEAARLRTFLAANDRFEKLRARIIELGTSGWKRQELYDLLEGIRDQHDEKLDEDILSIMDHLGGWCSLSWVIKTADSNGWTDV